MVQLWGDVPLVTKAVIGVNSENFEEVYGQVYPKRATTAEIYLNYYRFRRSSS